MAKIPYTKEELFGKRAQRSFTGDALKEIAFPLGGVGTGTISLGGRGNLRDWEIFNRPNKGKQPPYTFPAIWAKKAGGKPVARLLEARLMPSYVKAQGIMPDEVAGLPRLEKATFRGEYPFSWIDFEDKDLPVKVSLEAFNPFIPLNDKDSGLPVAILRYTLNNTTNAQVDASIAWSMCNCVGNQTSAIRKTGTGYGKNKNDYVDESLMRGLKMTGGKGTEKDTNFGSMALVTTADDVHALPAWNRGGWWDALQLFWNDFSETGQLKDNGIHGPSPDNATDIGTICCRVSLKPGETKTVTFLVSWYFPNRPNDGHIRTETQTWYSTQFANAWDAARYVVRNMDRLEKETRLFHNTLFSSTLPEIVLDAASANASIMRTNTCIRLADDRLYAYEGCNDEGGCCPLNCTHVWNYEQAVAFLFPKLERTMRQTDFDTNVRNDGKMEFRTSLPLGAFSWNTHGAADGQMGTVLKYYREWQLCGDQKFLEEIYPHAKKAIEYAWTEWDKDRDGVMEGIQHNTYDIEFYGPNTMMGSLYLGALKAMALIAAEIGDAQFATECKDIYDKGRVSYDKQLWNGDFYVQKYDPKEAQKYQFGEGCLSDQLLGQWFAHVAQLGYVLLEPHVKKTMESIFKYNWLSDLSDHYNCQRTYALNDEAGLVLCSWPNGGRPALPFVYSDEVWTGIEYQVAAHLIYEDMLEEGLAIVKGVRDRHTGVQRNPWDEFECGHHYARAMSSWSLILALSGYEYSAPEARIGFKPKVNAENFKTFFSTGSGWGQYRQKLDGKVLDTTLDVVWGELPITKVVLAWPKGEAPKALKVEASLGGQKVDARVVVSGKDLAVSLSKATAKPGAALRLRVTT